MLNKLLKAPLWVPLIVSSSVSPQEGIITVPVADLVGQSLRTLMPEQDVKKAYADVSMCFTYTGSTTCPRLHQALFNERVTILKAEGEELYIELPDTYYGFENGSKKNNRYWTLAQYVTPRAFFKQRGLSEQCIPSLEGESSTLHTIILTMPWYAKSTGYTYSVGTRFTVARTGLQSYSVYIFDPQRATIHIDYVPKSISIHQKHMLGSDAHIRTQFIKIIKRWIQNSSAAIPYVWGGASYTGISTQNAIGFDCAKLIFRGARISGIPLYISNSSGLAASLACLNNYESIRLGDIIWIPGHVIIISNITHNLAIEARGYDHGYGKLHEIPIAHLFKNIHTYYDLIHAYRNHIPLERLDAQKNVVQVIKEFKLLSLTSALSVCKLYI